MVIFLLVLVAQLVELWLVYIGGQIIDNLQIDNCKLITNKLITKIYKLITNKLITYLYK